MARARIVVLGGGFAGLEAVFHLADRLGDQAELTLVSREEEFTFRPNTIYIPFGRDPKRYVFPLAPPTRRRGIRFVHAPVRDLDPVARVVRLDEREIPFDFALVATGAAMRPDDLAGLHQHGLSIWSIPSMLVLRARFEALLDDARAGKARQVLFLVPPGNKCSGPLYEMVLMLDTWLRRKRVRETVDLSFATYEGSYIQAFGPRLNDVVTSEFVARGIAGRTRAQPRRVEEGRVDFEAGEALPYDLLVSFPAYGAAMHYPSLPADERGFLEADPRTRQVQGFPDVYAIGDAADFPVKQAFLALLQADAASEHLAQRVLGERVDAAFDPVSLCIMEELDTATFAQVPLRLTGDPLRPVVVDEARLDEYRVGVSKAWRVGKTMVGRAMPASFRAGRPFHAGRTWAVMGAGLRAMSSMLSSPGEAGREAARP